MMDIDSEEPPELVDLSAEDGKPVQVSSLMPPVIEMEDLAVSTVPLTIITGYLGSGKTTLVNYLLNAQHGKKIAVILNGIVEFGDSTPIERRAINITQRDQTSNIDFLTLGNGCICCSVKDAGLNAIEQLLSRHRQTHPFDSIVLETSGLADPGGIIPNFWTDEGLGSSVRLDGVVVVVDAGNILRSLDEPVGEEVVVGGAETTYRRGSEDARDRGEKERVRETIAHLQLTTADSILLNKTDLATPQQLSAVTDRIRSINSAALLTPTTYGRVPHLEGIVTDLHAYTTFTPPPPSSQHVHSSHLDPKISTLSLPLPALTQAQLEALEQWLRLVLWEGELPSPRPPSSSQPEGIESKMREGEQNRDVGDGEGFQIHRTKALFPLTKPPGGERMVQGVREIFEITEPAPMPSDSSSLDKQEGKEGSIVLIGKGLSDRGRWQRSLRGALGLQ